MPRNDSIRSFLLGVALVGGVLSIFWEVIIGDSINTTTGKGVCPLGKSEFAQVIEALPDIVNPSTCSVYEPGSRICSECLVVGNTIYNMGTFKSRFTASELTTEQLAMLLAGPNAPAKIAPHAKSGAQALIHRKFVCL